VHVKVSHAHRVFFLGKSVRTTAKTMVVDRKNQKALPLLGLASCRAAAKCGELKRCADRVGSTTDNEDEVVEDNFSNLNFLPSTKRQLSILLNFFFSFIDI